jgi:uroporphyrin-III C-methyltransferase
MGRKDAAKIAEQLIEQNNPHHANTPVQILEAVSTPRERLWSSSLRELASGKADSWFESSSPALIMVGEALRETQEGHLANSNSASAIQLVAPNKAA